MPRLSPLALRRGLRWLNALLVLIVVLLSLPLLGSKDGAGADAAPGSDAHTRWEALRVRAARWAPQQPVSDDDLDRHFHEYALDGVSQWPFNGAIILAAPEPDGPREGPVVARGLAELGRIAMLIANVRHPVLSFAFHPPQAAIVHVNPGQFIRRSANEPGRFRFVGIERRSEDVCHVHYEVLEDGAVVREAFLVHDTTRPLDPDGPLRPAGNGEAEIRIGPRATGPAGEQTPDAPRPKQVPVTLASAAPIRHINPRNRRDRVIEFDLSTYRLTRSQGLQSIAGAIKTAPVKDPATGRIRGLRVEGFDKRLPADKFDIRKGDLLVSIAGQKVGGREDVIRIAKTLDPDKLIPVVVDRRGSLHTYRIDARDPRTKRRFAYFENLR